MIDAPILTAEDVLITAFKVALTPFVGSYNGRPKAYYQMAEQGAPLPFLVFHLQADISRVDWLGQTGATGLVTIKALAASGTVARTLLATAAAGLAALTASGYRLTARYDRSPAIPPDAGVWQAVAVYRFGLERV